MRRALVIVLSLIAVAAVVLIPSATGADDGPYKVRGIFDNGAFIVNGEEVRVAGATVGTVESVGVTGPDEIASLEGGPHPVPGKAVVVMNITDDGFKDFREDASCIIRPQSLIGEKLVDCTPTQPRAAGHRSRPSSRRSGGRPGGGPASAALGEQRQGRRHRPDQQHQPRALPRPLPAHPQRSRRRPRRPRRRPRRDHRPRQPRPAPDQPRPQDPRRPERASSPTSQATGTPCWSRWPEKRTSVTGFFRNATIAGQATAERGDDLEADWRSSPGPCARSAPR